MNYIEKLKESAIKSENIICMGLDPVPEHLPVVSGKERISISSFFETLFNKMVQKNLFPGAFKANLGFFTSLDRPREGNFTGSRALAKTLSLIEGLFPDTPIILDYKRGDIARSSGNYAKEGFVSWGCDSVTVSPWMGSDSVIPFLEEAALNNGGVYILNRTSNPGGKDFQNLEVMENGTPLFEVVSKYIIKWGAEYPGTGAVAGATSLAELKEITLFFAGKNIPLLIPGVGSQGGSASSVMKVLKSTTYEIPLARINVSSALTHPWAKEAKAPPSNWENECTDRLKFYIEGTGGF